MESRAKLFGHPIHQMLIVFPVGLLVTSVLMDILFLITSNDVFSVVAFYNIGLGVLFGLVAAIFGAIDYFAIPGGTRAKRIGTLHGLGNVVVTLLFALSWFLRRDNSAYVPDTLPLVLSFLGVGIATVTAWMGGELVDRLGVGVDPGANLNAPSSLLTDETRPMAMEGIPVTGETHVLDSERVPTSEDEMAPPEGEERTGKIIDEP